MQIFIIRRIDRLITWTVDLLFSMHPGRRLRKVETDLSSIERAINKELMMSTPKEAVITALELRLNQRKADRAKILKQ